jgi:signal peptidase
MLLLKAMGKALNVLLIMILIFMAIAVVASKASGGSPSLLGYQFKMVLSGSMEPGIKTGSIVALKPGGDMSRFNKGDVITFKADQGILITHRVVKVIKNNNQVMYRTKGDNNDAADFEPVLSQNVVGEYNGFTIPYVGYAMNFANSKMGSVFLLITPGVLLLLYSIFTTWRAISELDKKKTDTTVSNPN